VKAADLPEPQRISVDASSFIQAFELDDYRRLTPLHGNALVMRAMLAAPRRGSGRRPHETRVFASVGPAAINEQNAKRWR
jgi:hypothetical protein